MHSVLIETQMRLDFPSKRGCSNSCVESHYVSRMYARQEVSALLGGCVIPSTPPERRREGWFLVFGFFSKCFGRGFTGADTAGCHQLNITRDPNATRSIVEGWLLGTLRRVASGVARDGRRGALLLVVMCSPLESE